MSSRGQQLTRASKIESISGLFSSQTWAKKTVLNQLSKMKVGQLKIVDGANISVFGDQSKDVVLSAEIVLKNDDLFSSVALNGVLGAGESYMSGAWQTPSLVKVIQFFVINMQTVKALDGQRSWLSRLGVWLIDRSRRNSLQGSKENISAHYDLGNDFFSLFLDPTMMYSSAVFAQKSFTLEQASLAKLETICRQLELSSDDHLLEIGTGWGGMAVYAAENFGCKVTTTTISKQQYEFALKRIETAGLSGQVTVLMEDYRKIEGRYDKLVSIEMIEAVGHQYFSEYFNACSNLLKPDGLMLLQAITIADQRYDQALGSVDFIQRYIFPGGCLPSNHIIARHVADDTDMSIIGLKDIGLDYAYTLEKWREQFFCELEQVKAQGFDQRFIRMWEYYLCYCEGGFRERAISAAQILMAKPAYRRV
ncbi:MAG: cyclopropane-fatty-acyl-phospholipid synthase family protein [Pseudomonadota bacterium]|nr:cyclopropane-fatty-acyl-phospholipid synthase family protein [Pseudomonadota bacterium]